MSLPEDRGRQGDGRPKVHRFRSQWLELGRRLRDFRARFGLRWLEVMRGSRFDLGRSLVPQLPLALLGAELANGR